MKRLVLCLVRVRRREYMSDVVNPTEDSLKQVWVGPNESPSYVVQEHYDRISDSYGTSWHVLYVDEVETIGSPE